MTPKLPVSSAKATWSGTCCCPPLRNPGKMAKAAPKGQTPPTDAKPISQRKQQAGM